MATVAVQCLVLSGNLQRVNRKTLCHMSNVYTVLYKQSVSVFRVEIYFMGCDLFLQVLLHWMGMSLWLREGEALLSTVFKTFILA